MSFLDNTGLAYFYNKLKGIFIRSVNGETPDALGNVRINEVELAKNLTAPDAQASIDTFIYRTTGGSASLSSGEANLVLINGNMITSGRVVEDVNISCNTDLILAVEDMGLLRTAVNNTTGTYNLNYTQPTSSEVTTSWTPAIGDWTYNNSDTSLATWGLSAQNLTAPSITLTVTGAGISAASVVPSTFISIINNSGTYTFSYIEDSGNNHWMLNDSEVVLSNYGISVTGTAVAGDSIAVNYTAGTTNTIATIAYTAPVQGTLQVATPTKFISTGFNQFDKDSTDVNQSGVIDNATISNGEIITNPNAGTYVCYCKAVGGEHGYIAESLGGHIVTSGGIGWCENVPQIGSTVVTISAASDDSVTSTSADFTYMQDGYMLVVVNDTSDLMMWCEWSGDVDGQQEYTAYEAPSEIDIPTVGYIESTQYDLPTATYGMPRLGTVYDTVNFEAGTYIKRIERLAYSASNLAQVQGMDPVPVYDYDNTNIFYVLATPVTYTFESTGGIYNADDHGTEEFLGTSVPVVAEMLYGQNLRDKLRTDVLTISKQNPPLTDTQKHQVLQNIGLDYTVVNNTPESIKFNQYIDSTGVTVDTDGTTLDAELDRLQPAAAKVTFFSSITVNSTTDINAGYVDLEPGVYLVGGNLYANPGAGFDEIFKILKGSEQIAADRHAYPSAGSPYTATVIAPITLTEATRINWTVARAGTSTVSYTHSIDPTISFGWYVKLAAI